MRNFLKAFTLAEVLIVLTIVGIIAVLTIPNLIDGYNKKIYVANVQKVYNLFSDAARKYLADNNTDSLAETDMIDLNGVGDFLNNYFKVVKNCGIYSEDGENCFADFYKDVVGRTDYAPDIEYRYCVIINTGAAICMASMSIDDIDIHGYSDVIFDVNGKKGPNTKGRDLFAFELYSDGKVSEGYNTQTKINNCDATIPDGGYASGCFTKLIENNWRMDY